MESCLNEKQNLMHDLSVITAVFCTMFFALSGILVNKDGVPEEEENFDEAIKAVNSALVPTRVR